MRVYETKLVQNLERLNRVKQQFVFRVYFSSNYEVYISTEDAASGIFLPDMQKGLERERGI
jgi:hypothetical protein